MLVAQRQRLQPVADGPGRGQQAAAVGAGLRSRPAGGAVRHPAAASGDSVASEARMNQSCCARSRSPSWSTRRRTRLMPVSSR